MPGPLRNVVLGAVAATVIAGCGSDDGTIPQDNAEDLQIRLDAIQRAVDEPNCEEAQAQADSFKSEVNLLPAPVDDEVKQGLQQAADQLVNLASNECQVETGTSDAGGVVPDTTEPETTEETTQPEETTEETTEEPEEEPAEPQAEEPQQDNQAEPPTGNQGQGGGSSGGVSSGGGDG